MALTRGTNSNFPCPVCLVPKEEMCKGIVYEIRTTETMEGVYNEAKEMGTAEEREKLLKSFGLRGVEVCGILHLTGCILIPYIADWIECILGTQEFRPISGPFI